MEEKWDLISSQYKDYFKIETKETQRTIVYINKFSELQFSQLQIDLQDIVYQHNQSVNRLLK